MLRKGGFRRRKDGKLTRSIGVTMLSLTLSLSSRLLLLLLLNFGVLKVLSVDNFSRYDFPIAPDFVFGSGTSAYQVEGAAFEDGRAPSIWDTFDHAGYTHGANGDIACDAYHKYKEDVQLMVDIGLEAYRFSISWPRLIPNGRGTVNPKGLQYYNNLIDELILHGIQPHVTLVHNDVPQVLEDEYGGFLGRKIVEDFTAYANVCFREFGDRVLHWNTFNEPNVFALGAYDSGGIPPGHCSVPFGTINCTRGNSSSEPYIVVHNIMLAHASAASLYNRKYKATQHGFIGLNLYAYWFVPFTNATEDVIATQRANDLIIGWIVNPLVFGDYPDTVKKNAGARIPSFTKLESKLVKGSFDFLGLNHYYTIYIKDNPSSLQKEKDVFGDMAAEMIYIQGDTPPDQYPSNPSGLRRLLEYFKHVYGNPPIYIHENGQRTRRNGTLNDTPRVKYLHGFIGSVLDAVRNGSNTRGYFAWSFLDGLELLDGYESAFGLYFVDLDDKDLKRYPKLSAHWYSHFLKGRNVSIVEYEVIQVEKNTSASSQSDFSW